MRKSGIRVFGFLAGENLKHGWNLKDSRPNAYAMNEKWWIMIHKELRQI